jgi:hypothetical protein
MQVVTLLRLPFKIRLETRDIVYMLSTPTRGLLATPHLQVVILPVFALHIQESIRSKQHLKLCQCTVDTCAGPPRDAAEAHLREQGAAVLGNAAASAALLVAAARLPLGVPARLPLATWDTARQLASAPISATPYGQVQLPGPSAATAACSACVGHVQAVS